jgi:hypothetical protein
LRFLKLMIVGMIEVGSGVFPNKEKELQKKFKKN